MTEIERLKALSRTNLIDSLPEERFDRLTRLAANALKTEVALVSLIDEDRQWFKSAHNLGTLKETDRCHAFCDHAIRSEDVMVVPDARKDPRFKSNPYVTGEPNIVFYAGAPLITKTGHALGTLCVIDSNPREDFSESDKQMLVDIAVTVMTEIEANIQLQVINDLTVMNEELKHRMGNMYAHVSSLISLMARVGGDQVNFAQRLRERISVLAKTQALVANHSFQTAPMSSIFQTTLAPFLTNENKDRVILDFSDDFDVSARGAFTLTLMINELATNAVKHGALKHPDGTVHFRWNSTEDEIKFEWKESSNNATHLPSEHKGFGSQILTRIVPLDFKGDATHDIEEDGLLYTVSAILDRVQH